MRKWPILILCLIALSFGRNDLSKHYVFPELNYFPEMPQSPINPVTNAGAQLGRHLFYDPVLSRDSTISCGSCHKQEFAFADGQKQFSDGIDGARTKRNALPLFNLAWYPEFFWDGRAASLEEQVFHPVSDTSEMDLKWTEAENRIANNPFYRKKFEDAFGDEVIDSTRIAFAIGQFLRTLISHNSKYDDVIAGVEYFNPDEFAGFALMHDMTKGDCLHCHSFDANALGTSLNFSNNGLDDVKRPEDFWDKGYGGHSGSAADIGKFKIPSLRNIALTAPYMHDGRFETLEEVLDFYSEGVHPSANIDSKMGLAHQGGVHLSEWEKCEIIAFLHTLTDSTFIRNPAFSDSVNFHSND